MSIEYSILGLLSWKPSTGYDIKKMFKDSAVLYWSGNNNQIYNTLLKLSQDGLVNSKVERQESLPDKKVYTITEKGREELKEWAVSPALPPEFKKPFLLRLAWGDQLSDKELLEMLTQYEKELESQLQIQLLRMKNKTYFPQRTPRETYLWDMIAENAILEYKNELYWAHKVHRGLLSQHEKRREERADFRLVAKGNQTYLECFSAKSRFCSEEDATYLCDLCDQNGSNLLLLHEEAISEEFFKLKTRVAEQMLQKLINFKIKVAAVISGENASRGRFVEIVFDSNSGRLFRVFENVRAAEEWLLQ